MPIYEYECQKCGRVSSFMEKMFERPRLFGRKKKCKHCGSKKLTKIISACSGKVERTYTETLNELKSMGNVSFTPSYPNTQPQGPPPGGCPYERAAKEEEARKAEEKKKSPIIINS